jgi:hypothetical protein
MQNTSPTIGLVKYKTGKTVPTPIGGLISFLLVQIDKANTDLLNGKPVAARVELEYALHEAGITLEDNPEICRMFYIQAD